MKLARYLLTLSVLIWASSGHAQLQPGAAEPDAIQLDVLDCAQVSGASVRALVALEVAPRRVLAVGSTATAATHASLSCPTGVAQISVDDTRLASPLRLEIALHDLDPPARSRLAALAIAELITTGRLQRSGVSRAGSDASASSGSTGASEAAGAARVSAGSAEVDASNDDAVSDKAPEWDGDAAGGGGARWGAQVWLGFGAARVAEPSMLAPAAAVGVSLYWRALALNVDARFEHAQRAQSVAELQLDAGSLALAPAWRLHSRSADISIGPGVRAGYASLRATPRDAAFLGQTLDGFWLAPCAQLALQLRFAERWAVRIGAELAYITRTVRGLGPNGSSVLALRDLALAAQLGISWDAIAAR